MRTEDSIHNEKFATAAASSVDADTRSRCAERQAGGAFTYIPQEVLGQGSFGVVVHAKVRETGEDVAIKRVLYDERLHSRELFLMRDVLNDASVPRDNMNTSGKASRLRSSGAAPTVRSGRAATPKNGVLCQSPLSSVKSPLPEDKGSNSETDLSVSQSGLGSSVCSSGSFSTKRLPVVLLKKHPNVAHLRSYYISTEDDSGESFLHLVMSYLPTDLQSWKRNYFKQRLPDRFPAEYDTDSSRTSCVPLMWTKVFLFQIARALTFLHARSVCHRDLKPANVLVDPQTGRLQLCDFGSAKQIHNRKTEKNVSYICSRFYRAPELLFGALHYGTEVDMWSLGCIAAELLRSEGAPVFKGSTTVDQMAEIFKVLGAPSAAEMFAMNPQSAQAMLLARSQFHPAGSTSARASQSAAFSDDTFRTSEPSSNFSDGQEHFEQNHPQNAGGTSEKTENYSHTSSLALGSDYFHCYDVLRVKALQWKHVLHADTPEAGVDFVSQLLCYIPEKRMTAAAAVEHPFFRDLFSSPQTSKQSSGDAKVADDLEKDETRKCLPRLPNGRPLPVEMFLLTELETNIYSEEFQNMMSLEVQRISSVTAATASSTSS